jgi:molybdenum cofactor guanylyltransferase
VILGAVLAGGKAMRFGSDKALAELGGRTLLSRSVDTLSGWCEHVIVTGRSVAPAPTLPDWPRSDMGPLAGLAAALHHARDEGYEAVLSCGVDTPDLPDSLPRLLSPAPACLATQPVIGLWPVALIEIIEPLLLDASQKHSMYRFAELSGARLVEVKNPPTNINSQADLEAFDGGSG